MSTGGQLSGPLRKGHASNGPAEHRRTARGADRRPRRPDLISPLPGRVTIRPLFGPSPAGSAIGRQTGQPASRGAALFDIVNNPRRGRTSPGPARARPAAPTRKLAGRKSGEARLGRQGEGNPSEILDRSASRAGARIAPSRMAGGTGMMGDLQHRDTNLAVGCGPHSTLLQQSYYFRMQCRRCCAILVVRIEGAGRSVG
jgi:hypothetical protein